jgi:hypothetical protein
MGWLSSIAAPFKSAGQSLLSSGTLGLYNPKGEAAQEGYNSSTMNSEANLAAGMQEAQKNIKSGYKEAKDVYQEPGMVQSRQELYKRLSGQGGYTPGTVNAMKGNAIEQGGVQSRDVENALRDRYGDATSGGMTGENLARALTTIGGTRANALRDVDIQNAQLAEQQQTGAIGSLESDAAARAALATGQAGLQAGLTAEQAKALAEMESGRNTANLTLGSQKGLLSSILG